MRVYTAHLRTPRAGEQPPPPVLLREGFSVAAMLLGPVWLLARGAWCLALVTLAVELAAVTLVPAAAGAVVLAAIAWVLGLEGTDLVRTELGWRGFALCHVIAARDQDAAFVRLLDARPDLAGVVAGLR